MAASSKGLGRAVAAELAAEGARVVISGRDEAALDEAASGIDGEVACHAADVRREEDIRGLVERFGGLDVLVNNAGGPPAGDEEWREAFETNLMSVIRLVRSALPHLKQRGGGRILTIASSSVKQPIENLILSNIFRAGIAGLSKSLATEFAPDGVLVNVLGPGRIATDRSASMDAATAESRGVSVEQVREQMSARIPLGRYGTPEELAKVAAFLCSPANGYVTGQALLVDGGMVRAL